MILGLPGLLLVTGAIADPTNSVASVFLQYGVLGAFALFGLWFFRTVYKRETERADRAEVALADLNRDVRDKVIPVVTESNRLVTEANRTISEVAILFRDVKGSR